MLSAPAAPLPLSFADDDEVTFYVTPYTPVNGSSSTSVNQPHIIQQSLIPVAQRHLHDELLCFSESLSDKDVLLLANRLGTDVGLRARAGVSSHEDAHVVAVKVLLQHMQEHVESQKEINQYFSRCLQVMVPHCGDPQIRVKVGQLQFALRGSV
eukprot:PhF_6_TR6019/c0_g1_i1/m.8667